MTRLKAHYHHMATSCAAYQTGRHFANHDDNGECFNTVGLSNSGDNQSKMLATLKHGTQLYGTLQKTAGTRPLLIDTGIEKEEGLFE